MLTIYYSCEGSITSLCSLRAAVVAAVAVVDYGIKKEEFDMNDPYALGSLEVNNDDN